MCLKSAQKKWLQDDSGHSWKESAPPPPCPQPSRFLGHFPCRGAAARCVLQGVSVDHLGSELVGRGQRLEEVRPLASTLGLSTLWLHFPKGPSDLSADLRKRKKKNRPKKTSRGDIMVGAPARASIHSDAFSSRRKTWLLSCSACPHATSVCSFSPKRQMGVTAGERREESLHPLELEPSLLRGHWAGFQSMSAFTQAQG